MRTDEDVRRAIDELSAESVPVGRALHNLSRRLEERRQPRRTWRSPQVLAAVVVLAAVAIAMAGAAALRPTRSGTAAQPLPSSPGPTTSVPCALTTNPSLDTFAVLAVPGLTSLRGVTQEAWCSGARIRGFFSRTIGAVTVIVYRPDVFDAASVHKLPTVTGDGITAHTGLLAPDIKLYPGCGVVGASMARAHPRCVASQTVAWSYAPNAWATVSSNRFSAQKALPATTVDNAELAVAAAVDPASSTRYLLPFRIAKLGDLHPQSLSTTVSGASVNLTSAGLDQQCDPFEGCVRVSATSLESATTSSPIGGRPVNPPPTGRKVTVRGHSARFYPATDSDPTERVDVRAGYWTYTVSANARLTGLTANQILDLARRVQLAPGHAGTIGWFTAQQALAN